MMLVAATMSHSHTARSVGAARSESYGEFCSWLGILSFFLFFFLQCLLYISNQTRFFLFFSVSIPSFRVNPSATCPSLVSCTACNWIWLAERFSSAHFLHRICRYGDRPAYSLVSPRSNNLIKAGPFRKERKGGKGREKNNLIPGSI